MTGSDPFYGVRVTVSGDQIAVTGAGVGTDFDQYSMNRVDIVGGDQVLNVAEDGADCGLTRGAQMSVVAPQNGVTPTSGSFMLEASGLTSSDPRFLFPEQLVKIEPGMRFSYDMYLLGASGGSDAVTVQPDWYMKDGSMPPLIVDQNGIQLSRRTKDGMSFPSDEDVPALGGRATDRWYHREFDLTPMAGNYVDGVYLASSVSQANGGTIYVDNIKFMAGAHGELSTNGGADRAVGRRHVCCAVDDDGQRRCSGH